MFILKRVIIISSIVIMIVIGIFICVTEHRKGWSGQCVEIYNSAMLFSEYLNKNDYLYPKSKGDTKFNNSTEYFNWLILNGGINAVADLFDYDPDVSKQIKRGEMLHRQQNIWCIVADLDRYYNRSIPLLLSKNILITNLHNISSAKYDYSHPTFSGYAVIIAKGDSSKGPLVWIISPSNEFSVVQEIYFSTNAILRP